MSEQELWYYQNKMIIGRKGKKEYSLQLSDSSTSMNWIDVVEKFARELINHVGSLQSISFTINMFYNYETKFPQQRALADLAEASSVLAKQLLEHPNKKEEDAEKRKHIEQRLGLIGDYGWDLAQKIREPNIKTPYAFGLETYWNELGFRALHKYILKSCQQ